MMQTTESKDNTMQSSTAGYAYYNDIDAFCCKVLRKNIALGNLPGGKVDEKDIREVGAADFVGYQHIHLFAGIGAFALGMSWANYPSSIRTITGGFPCTDISNAGKRAGITGSQSGLWKEMYRIIQEAIDLHMGPDVIILENVSALINRGLSTVLADLAQIRFNAEWHCLRASDFGAPQQRERVFIVAYPCSKQFQRGRTIGELAGTAGKSKSSEEKWEWIWNATSNCRAAMEDTSCQGSSPEWDGTHARAHDTACASGTKQAESGVCRGPHGFSDRLDRPQRWPAGPGEQQHEWEPPRVVTDRQPDRAKRLKALGNAIVPQCVEYVARCVIEMSGTDFRKGL